MLVLTRQACPIKCYVDNQCDVGTCKQGSERITLIVYTCLLLPLILFRIALTQGLIGN